MKAIQGPYQVNPEFEGTIQTQDATRDLAMIMPDFAYDAGVTEEEHLPTIRLLAASWTLREHLRDVVQGTARLDEIKALLETLP